MAASPSRPRCGVGTIGPRRSDEQLTPTSERAGQGVEEAGIQGNAIARFFPEFTAIAKPKPPSQRPERKLNETAKAIARAESPSVVATRPREHSGPRMLFQSDRCSMAEEGEAGPQRGARPHLLQPSGRSNPAADPHSSDSESGQRGTDPRARTLQARVAACRFAPPGDSYAEFSRASRRPPPDGGTRHPSGRGGRRSPASFTCLISSATAFISFRCSWAAATLSAFVVLRSSRASSGAATRYRSGRVLRVGSARGQG